MTAGRVRAPEVRVCDDRRVEPIVTTGFRAELDPSDEFEKRGAEFHGREVTVADPANSALHEQISFAVGRHSLGVDDFIVHGHEQVAEIMEREHRDRDVARDRRNLGESFLVPPLSIWGDPEDALIEGLLLGSQSRIRVELIDDIAVVQSDAGRPGQRPVTDGQVEKEVAGPAGEVRESVPEEPRFIEVGSIAA